MSHALTEKDIKGIVERLKHNLAAFKTGTWDLELLLESAAKHIPVYLKIIKTHIDQLAKVLELETHNRRNLDTVGLAEPVTQLMQLFRELNDEDIQLLEMLAVEAHNWSGVAEPLKEDLRIASEV